MDDVGLEELPSQGEMVGASGRRAEVELAVVFLLEVLDSSC